MQHVYNRYLLCMRLLRAKGFSCNFVAYLIAQISLNFNLKNNILSKLYNIYQLFF